MRRHRSIGLLAGTLLAMALATSVAAKGSEDEVVVALDPPNDPHAGAPIEVGVLITRADGSAVRGESVTFQLAKNGGIGLVTAQATEDTIGHYTAMVTVPSKGSWTVIVNATGQGRTQTFHAGDMQMGAPLAAPTPATPPAATVPAWILIAGLLLLAAAAGVAGRIAAIRRRSPVAADRA
jgi:hypothetical protein